MKLLSHMPGTPVQYHPDGSWAQIEAQWSNIPGAPPLSFLVRHDPSIYAGKGREKELKIVQNSLSVFRGIDKRKDVRNYFNGMNFVIAFALEPQFVKQDPRQAIILDLAEALQGVILLSWTAMDANCHTILDVDGKSDPKAKLPFLTQEKEEPPGLGKIRNRLTLMIYLVERSFMENDDDVENENWRRQSLESVLWTPPWAMAEPWEREALETPVGKLDPKIRWKLSWYAEGAIFLAWSLNLAQLPAYDSQVDPNVLMDLLPKLMSADPLPEPRSLREVHDAAFQMLAIHWRVREFHARRNPIDFAAVAQKAWCGPMDLSMARIMEKDLMIGDRPIAKAEERLCACTNGNMEERRRTAHWLLGREPVYSKNSTST